MLQGQNSHLSRARQGVLIVGKSCVVSRKGYSLFTVSALLPVFLRKYPSIKEKAVEHIGSPTNIEQYACRKCEIEYSLSEFPMKECKQGAEHNKPCSCEVGFDEIVYAQYNGDKPYNRIDCLPHSVSSVFHRIEQQKDKERCCQQITGKGIQSAVLGQECGEYVSRQEEKA